MSDGNVDSGGHPLPDGTGSGGGGGNTSTADPGAAGANPTGTAANPALNPVTAFNGQYFVGEDEFILGKDGSIYQRQRDGFRTLGWRQIGTTADIAGAAAVGGVVPQILSDEINKQTVAMHTTNWQLAQSNQPGLTNEQLLEQAQASAAQTGLSENAWKMAKSAFSQTGQTNQEYEQSLQAAKDYYGTNETAYDTLHQAGQHTLQDLQRDYGTQEGQYNLSVIGAQHNLQDLQRNYNTQETGYNLENIGATHNLQDLQRNLNTQTATWQLGHLAQTQANDAFHLNQQGYENQKGSSDRDTTGYGYAAMTNPGATRLVGQ